jgi:Mg/Co/Ni transporter MgtE
MIKLSEEGIQELWEKYETMQILYAVDALDEVRGIIADDGIRPPEIRAQLLKIHQLVHQQLNEGFTLTDEEVEQLADLIDEVDMAVFQVIEQLQKIKKTLRPLQKMFTWEE